jgi:Na+/proline symporter
MDRQIVIGTIIVLGVLFTGLSFVSRKQKRRTVYEFFLASRSLRPSLITSLLVSGSFSLNGMLYQIYLGYKIGIWGLLPQVAWAVSFVLLAKFSSRLAGSNGLHDFLGRVFSPATRKVAALCSIAGLSLQIGWEYSVAKSAFSSLTNPHLNEIATVALVGAVFAICTFYTMVGGLRSNSVTDLLQNLIKGACFACLGVFGYLAIGSSHGYSVWASAFPSPSAAIVEFTISGLLANLAFSLAWQFVDMTTWQTAIATSRQHGSEGTARALRSASKWVFVAPGVLGTFVGIALAGRAGLDPNTVLPALLAAAGGMALLIILTVALVATVMSFVDGMLLGIGFTVVTDLMFGKTVRRFRLLDPPTDDASQQLDYQQAVARVMAGSRMVLVVAAISGTLLLDFVSNLLGLDLFQQLYVITISQLALTGPVIRGLLAREGSSVPGPLIIGASLAAGFGMIAAGFAYQSSDCTNLAPVGTLLVSLGLAWPGSRPRAHVPVSSEPLVS